MKKIFDTILKSGSVIALAGSVSSGKTNNLFNFIEVTKQYNAKKFAYFYHAEYRESVKGVEFLSTLEELEQIQQSFIFIDEFLELFKLSDRHSIEMVKRVMAQVKHNQNILVLAGVPEYYKKFISAVVDEWVLHKIYFSELINGSDLKKYVKSLSGDFVGGTMLNIPLGFMLWRGTLYKVQYHKELDKKANGFNMFAKVKK